MRRKDARKDERRAGRTAMTSAFGTSRGRFTLSEALEQRVLLSVVGFSSATYDVGSDPTGVALANIYSSTRQDIVSANYADKTLSLLKNSGDGTFAAAQTIPLGGHAPCSIVSADFNGDGIADLAVSIVDENAVAVLMGRGDGIFQAPVLYPVGTAPKGLATGYFSGNGVDLAAADSGSNQISILLNDGKGNFSTATPLSTPGSSAYVTVADIDRDGHDDIAVAGPGINLYWGLGGGNFSQPTSFNVPGDATGRVQIVNASNDLVVASATGKELVGFPKSYGRVYYGPTPLALPASGLDMVTGSFDTYVATDVAVLLPGGPQGSVVVADGSGGGGYWLAQSNDPIGPPAVAITSGDLNGDGLSDVVLATTSNQLQVLLSQPIAGVANHQFSSYSVNDSVVFADNAIPFVQSQGVPEQFTAMFDWGDGSISPGDVEYGGANTATFIASSIHHYLSDGAYTIHLTITDKLGNSSEFTATDTVADAPAATITEFPISGPTLTYTPYGPDWPDNMAPGPGGDVWFGENPDYQVYQVAPHASAVGLVTSAAGIRWYTLPDQAAGTRLPASDGEGNAWTTAPTAHIDRVTPAGDITTFSLPATATALTRGTDGNVWFVAGSSTATDHLGFITFDGQVTQISLTKSIGRVAHIAFGADGNLWATETDRGMIARITPSGVVSEFDIPSRSGLSDPSAITLGADGNIWFGEQNGKVVGRVTPAGIVSEFPASGDPVGLSAGPDGAVWAVEYNSNKIERFTEDGRSQVYSVPTGSSAYPGSNRLGTSYPYSIAASPDGQPTMWFTEMGTNQIGRIDLQRAIVFSPTSTVDLNPGQPFSGTLTNFSHAISGLPGDSSSNYTAAIDWGDGSAPDTGTITQLPSGDYAVSGSHTYTAEGVHTATITVTPAGDQPVQTKQTFVVDYPLTAAGTSKVFATAGVNTGSVPLFTFADADPSEQATEFTATINWADGTNSAGTVSDTSTPGTVQVSGAHTYANLGTYPIHIHVTDAGGQSLDADMVATVVHPATFAPAGSVPITGTPAVTATGDVTGDGIDDMVVASANTLVVLPGLATGGFGQPIITSLPSSPFAVALGDFNHDKKLDVFYLSISGPRAMPPPGCCWATAMVPSRRALPSTSSLTGQRPRIPSPLPISTRTGISMSPRPVTAPTSTYSWDAGTDRSHSIRWPCHRTITSR